MSIVVRENIPLAPSTSFKIGGPARYFCEPENEEELREALKKARELGAPFFVLGGGSNVLISDSGFKGLVIRMKRGKSAQAIRTQGDRLTAPAGALLGQALDRARRAGLAGLEWAAGLPGTVGGAVRGNAGIPDGSAGDAVVKVRALRSDGAVHEYDRDQCRFGYRDSIFKHNGEIILSVELQLRNAAPEEIQRKIAERTAYRIAKHPLEYPSAGCIFKNAPAAGIKQRFQEKFKEAITNDKISAGYLIAEAGLKGKIIGKAMVSERHANFIVNTGGPAQAGGATAEEVVMLIALIKEKIHTKFGVFLEEEIQYVGF